MDTYQISGGGRIDGTVCAAGAKNALLPLLAASVLGKGESVLHNCPALSDVYAMLGILEAAGCRTEFSDGNIRICPDGMKETFLHGDLVKQMRSSVFLLGPVLALKGSVCMGFPGGCAIGRRPVDIHLSALRKMGADIEEREETIICRCERLHGAVIRLPFPSVGATENIMMAAALADGITVIRNAAREPEIEELQNFMNKMGAEICGAGTSVIIIAGKKRLSGAEWNVMSDRIEAGTLILAAAVTGGRIFVKNVRAEYMEAFLSCMEACGMRIDVRQDGIEAAAPHRLKAAGKVPTGPYPGFPTDLQSQLLAVMTTADGVSMIEENIFEDRFKVLKPLRLMGADISLQGRSACVNGVPGLHGARVCAEDLRGGAALVLAALAAEGRTVIENVTLIDRGYEKLEKTLSKLGAEMIRITEGRDEQGKRTRQLPDIY